MQHLKDFDFLNPKLVEILIQPANGDWASKTATVIAIAEYLAW